MELEGRAVAVLVEDLYEDLELWYPVYRLREAGARVGLVGPEAGKTHASNHGYPATADRAAKDVAAADFDAIVIPGGDANAAAGGHAMDSPDRRAAGRFGHRGRTFRLGLLRRDPVAARLRGGGPGRLGAADDR